MSTSQASENAPVLSIVIPMFNEEEGVAPLFARLLPILQETGLVWEIVCVNDGSRDLTLSHLQEWHRKNPRIKLVDLSRNFGKDIALSAGLDYTKGAAVIPLDADLQDPPELIGELIAEWKKGYKVVLATRRSRPGDSWVKQKTAYWFYRVMNSMSVVPVPANTGDFRLMDRDVVEAVKRMPERIRFLKGMFAWAGFSTQTVYYDRTEREAGTTSWSFWTLWKYALDGIFSFTTIPLQVWTYLGACISLVAFIYAIWLIIKTLWFGADVPGYTSLMVVMLFMGGIQLLSLGIIGEYVGRAYRESKRRPLYFVQNTLGF